MDPSPASQRDLTLLLLQDHGMMRLSELKKRGIHPPTLSRMVEKGTLIRPSRGLYQLAGADMELGHNLAELAKRVPKAVIALISALQYHEITLQNARSVWMAIGEKDRKPKIDYPPARFVRFGEKALTAGIERRHIEGVEVKIFDPAKTVVDCFRYRKSVGLDVAMEALRMALRSKKATPGQIATYAQELRIWGVLRPYLDIAAANDT